MDISTKIKNVNIKLSSDNIQLCGAKTLDVAIEGASHVIDHANRIQSDLDFMRNNPDLVEKAIKWMDKKTVGKLCEKQCEGEKQCEDSEIILPWFDVNNIEEGRIVEFLYSLAADCVHHGKMMNAVRNYYTKVTSVCKNLSIRYNDIRREMTNYNYDTGFTIDRRKLYTAINQLNDMGKVPCIASYWNLVFSYVSVYLPVETEFNRPRNKKRKSTIMIYRSGRVTCSSKDPTEGERFYTMFSKIIMKLEAYVRVPEIRDYTIKRKIEEF
uniref:Uncharacterized protein n=1 Tax=Pithovirus LCPAC403 TaxID=2506596 RepID=A0A481ZBL7_9VIRU|nr:MAG: uncharacterized protein LCPAC403_01700 [Pithovirus LCPAC403]